MRLMVVENTPVYIKLSIESLRRNARTAKKDASSSKLYSSNLVFILPNDFNDRYDISFFQLDNNRIGLFV